MTTSISVVTRAAAGGLDPPVTASRVRRTSEPDFAELADALVDPVAAAVHRHDSGVTYAGGVEVATVDEVTEVLLARAGSADQASAMVANATRALGGRLPTDTQITLVGDSTVRAAGHPVTYFKAALTVRQFEIFSEP
jgi:hypothetical protein